MTGAAEQTFFQQQNVVVTNARFIARGQTFAMAQVSAVKAESDPWLRLSWALPSAAGGTMVLLGALLTLDALVGGLMDAYHDSSSLMFGIAVLGPGILLGLFGIACFFNRQHHVVVSTSGGNIHAFSSHDIDFVTQVVSAVRSALIARG